MSNYASLPGFAPTFPINQTNFKKVSHVKQAENREVPAKPQLYPLPRQKQEDVPCQKAAQHPDYITSNQAVYISHTTQGQDVIEQYQPNWVKMDKQVLQFKAYFKESCVETALEAYRVRKLTVFYYLEDNTCEIYEPKQVNSGIPQGCFLKRQKVLKRNSNKFIEIDDFHVGQDIEFFGKMIRLTACDTYTREFYENINLPQGPNGNVEQDNWEKKTNTKYVPQKDSMMKDYLEHKLGGGRIPSQKQFLENDRKVLKFYVFSDVPYILHYYLADDTLEIREVKFANSGRANFSLMLRRQKLPKKFALNQPGQTYAEKFVKTEDIVCGQQLEVFGRKFDILGVDKFTQDYYRKTFNIDYPIGTSEQEQQFLNVGRQIPPYNGFGDEEDSLGYVYRLVPIPPKKDFFKWVDNQVNLRFVAKLKTTKPEDINRRFIITFFLNDDSVMVYEPTIRNSGIPDGKFLERGKYKNFDNNEQFFSPPDFSIGSVLKINEWQFQLLECDEFTKKWYSTNVMFVKEGQQFEQQREHDVEEAQQQLQQDPNAKSVSFQEGKQ